MAAEVMDCEYLFLPSSFEDEARLTLRERLVSFTLSSSETPASSKPVFLHNGLHDVEAIWWCTVYLLFFNRLASVTETGEQANHRQAQTAKIFPDVLEGSARKAQLIDTDIRIRAFKSLTWLLLKEFVYAIAAIIEFPICLVQAYQAFEAGLVSVAGRLENPDAIVSCRRVYSKLNDVLGLALIAFSGRKFVPVKIVKLVKD